jgi:hypothetical protein
MDAPRACGSARCAATAFRPRMRANGRELHWRASLQQQFWLTSRCTPGVVQHRCCASWFTLAIATCWPAMFVFLFPSERSTAGSATLLQFSAGVRCGIAGKPERTTTLCTRTPDRHCLACLQLCCELGWRQRSCAKYKLEIVRRKALDQMFPYRELVQAIEKHIVYAPALGTSLTACHSCYAYHCKDTSWCHDRIVLW